MLHCKKCSVLYFANNHLTGVDWSWTLDCHYAVGNNIVSTLSLFTEVNGGSV